MGQVIKRFSLIMILNLFAFLAIWHTLDVILESNAMYKIIFLVLSLPSLIFFSKFFLKKALKDIADTDPK